MLVRQILLSLDRARETLSLLFQVYAKITAAACNLIFSIQI